MQVTCTDLTADADMSKVSADQKESSTRKMIKSIDQQVARSFRVGKKQQHQYIQQESDPINQIFPTLHQLPGAFLAEVSNGPATALVRRGVLFARFFGSFYRILDSNSITCIAFRAPRTSQTYLPSAGTVTSTFRTEVHIHIHNCMTEIAPRMPEVVITAGQRSLEEMRIYSCAQHILPESRQVSL